MWWHIGCGGGGDSLHIGRSCTSCRHNIVKEVVFLGWGGGGGDGGGSVGGGGCCAGGGGCCRVMVVA